MSVTTKRRRKRYVSGSREREYVSGSAAVDDDGTGEPALVAQVPTSEPDLIWHIYGCSQWLVGEWAPHVEERLDAVNAELYDVADRVNQLIIMVCIGMLAILAGVGILLFLAVS